MKTAWLAALSGVFALSLFPANAADKIKIGYITTLSGPTACFNAAE